MPVFLDPRDGPVLSVAQQKWRRRAAAPARLLRFLELSSAPVTRCESSSIGAVFASRRQKQGGSRVDARRRPCDDEDRTSSQ